MNINRPAKKLRTLIIPDYKYWVTGTIAKAIADNNLWIDATICSGSVLKKVLLQFPSLVEEVDLVHFLTPWESKDLLFEFNNKVPCLTTIHHVHDWEGIAHNITSDGVMVVSSEWQDKLAEKGISNKRTICISNGVYSNIFKPASIQERKKARQQIGIKLNSLTVGFFAKKSSDAMSRKGIDIFLKAMNKLKSKVSNLTALVVGPGWQDAIFELKNYDIECVWLPFILEHKNLVRAYQALDLYWITSRIEGGPVTLLEAMSCGVCCLTTPVGIAKDIVVNGQNGFVIPFNDVDSFVQHSCELFQVSQMREFIAKNARQTILEGYQWEQTTQKVSELYAVGIDNFSKQQNIKPKLNVRALSETAKISSIFHRSEYLGAIPSKMRGWVKTQEKLLWMDHLLKMEEKRAALRIGLSACATSPNKAYVLKKILYEFANKNLIQILHDSKELISR